MGSPFPVPTSDVSWAIQAIEHEAMRRAERALATMPQVFYWMSVRGEQLTWLVTDYEARTGQRAAELDPAAPVGGEPPRAPTPEAIAALRDLVRHYVELVNCGDCGNWDPETEVVVKDARVALKAWDER